MTDRADKTATAPMRRPLRLLLVVSLAFNLLVVGAIAGLFFSGKGPGPHRGISLGLGPVVAALDPADRDAIVSDLRQRDAHPWPGRAERREAMNAMVAALRNEPFDQTAFTDILDALRLRSETAQVAGQAALVTRIGAMTSEARLAFADRLEAGLSRRPSGDNPPAGHGEVRPADNE